MSQHIASFIDHTLLSAISTRKDIIKLCREGNEWECACVCVNPYFVELAAKELKGSLCKVTTVVGFPLGQNLLATKVFEIKKALEDGADEIDMVINISALKEGLIEDVLEELSAARLACKTHILKVIIETAYLTDAQKQSACELIIQSGADFVKTSTGFAPHGALIEDVKLLRTLVGSKVGIKASGGICTLEVAKSMLHAGASRIGCSHTEAIIFG